MNQLHTWGELASSGNQTVTDLGNLILDLKASQPPEVLQRIDLLLDAPLDDSLSVIQQKKAFQGQVITLLRDIDMFDAPLPG